MHKNVAALVGVRRGSVVSSWTFFPFRLGEEETSERDKEREREREREEEKIGLSSLLDRQR